MSGVVALFARDGSVVDGSEVSRVLEHQAYRGPDGLRAWCDGPVGLGFASLDPTGNGVAKDPLVVGCFTSDEQSIEYNRLISRVCMTAPVSR